MKLIKKYLITFTVILIAIIFVLLRNMGDEIYTKIEDIFKGNQNISHAQTTTTLTQKFPTTTVFITEDIGRIPTSPPSQTQPQETASKVITLEIIDICSGRMENVFAISEGMRQCLNQKYPYFILIEKNFTHLKTSFYNTTGFTEYYMLNESCPTFYIFVEDVTSVSTEIKSFYFTGSTDFYLGEYNLHTVYTRNEGGILTISKMIAALPLYTKPNVSETEGWEELKFYINVPNKKFYVGNLWVLVRKNKKEII